MQAERESGIEQNQTTAENVGFFQCLPFTMQPYEKQEFEISLGFLFLCKRTTFERTEGPAERGQGVEEEDAVQVEQQVTQSNLKEFERQ
jgi:hypothetical protein